MGAIPQCEASRTRYASSHKTAAKPQGEAVAASTRAAGGWVGWHGEQMRTAVKHR